MTTSNSPRGTCPGKPEGELRRSCPVEVRSFDARRRLGNVSEDQAGELLRLGLCCEKLTISGKRLYLRFMGPEEDMPKYASNASLITVRHVQGLRSIRSGRGDDYYEHRFPDSVTITDRKRR